MNDFVAKPIELRVITSKLRKWLPKEKILKKNKEGSENLNPNAESKKSP